MWLLFGMTILLSRAVIANINDENAYYMTEMVEDRALMDNEPRETSSKIATSETTESNDVGTDQEESGNRLADGSGSKSEPKRSIVETDSRERVQAPAPLATLLYWPDHQEQVMGMEEFRNPVIQERRNPSFSPWGGKRDDRYKTKIRRPVRVPFNSWGGKRNGNPMQSVLAEIKRGLDWNAKKSPPFNSWGGKRASLQIDTNYDSISNRAHKTDGQRDPSKYQQQQMRMNFDVYNSLKNGGQVKDYHEKSTSSKTAVKHGPLVMIGDGDLWNSRSSMSNYYQKAPFVPWGGKRQNEMIMNDELPRSATLSLIFHKKRRPIPWTE